MKKTRPLLFALTLALTLSAGCTSDEDPVRTVKDGLLAENPSLSVGRALDNYGDCVKGTQTWTSLTGEDGRTLVEFTCRLESAQYGWTQGRLATAEIFRRENPKEIVTLLARAGGMRVADRAVIERYNAELDRLSALSREEQYETAGQLVREARERIKELRERPEEGLYLGNAFLNTLVNRIETLFAVSEELSAELSLVFRPELDSKACATFERAELRAVWPERTGVFKLDRAFVMPRMAENVPIVNNASIYPLSEWLQPNKGSERIIFIDREN